MSLCQNISFGGEKPDLIAWPARGDSLPSHVEKLKKPPLHASHLSLIILALQLHTPLSSHASPFDPSALQLQSAKGDNKT